MTVQAFVASCDDLRDHISDYCAESKLDIILGRRGGGVDRYKSLARRTEEKHT